MEKRIDVVTRHAVRNYGSALQSLATRVLLEQGGAEARFIDYRQPGYDDTGWSYANRGQARRFNVVGRAAYAALREPSARAIGRNFESFLRTSIPMTGSTYRSTEALSASTEFLTTSAFCVGSDQVWNVEYNVDNRPYYLSFLPPESFRFSLASSIGVQELPADEAALLAGELESFAGVSVRERDAVEYLATLNVAAEQHVDPTLALDPDFWRTFAEAPRSERPYILVYQLNGGADLNPVVDAISRFLSIPVRRIEYWRGPRSLKYPAVVNPTVEQFVGLFAHASFVVTDSFHGAVFSSVFDTPFVSVAPPKYASRITSLLELTGQMPRLVRSVSDALEVAAASLDSSAKNIALERERERVRAYIKRTLALIP